MQLPDIPGLGGRPIIDGQIHRYAKDGTSKKDAWYVLHAEGDKYWGAYGDWKTGETTSVRHGNLTREQIQRAVKVIDRAREDDAQHAARAAAGRWARARTVDGPHPNAYLERKRVIGYGVRYEGDLVLIPMLGIGGEMRGVQSIAPDGTKLFTKGCQKKGAFHEIPGLAAVVIAEGYATAASIHAATGMTCLVAFDRGNLEPVARAYKEAHPRACILIAADDDHRTVCDRHKREGVTVPIDPRTDRETWCRCNPGLTAGLEVQRALKVRLVIPDLKGVDGTDFNDIHLGRGISEVARQIFNAI